MWVLRTAAVVAALAVVGSACGTSENSTASGERASTTSAASPTPSLESDAPPTNLEPESVPAVIGVARSELVDPGRITPASHDEPQRDDRRLPTVAWYPARADAEEAVVSDADPDLSQAPYPLVVFAHGLGGTPEDGEALAKELVSAGFVVVAPAFPLTRADTPGGIDLIDLGNQPGDASFLISTALDDPSTIGLAPGLIDPDRIGAIGHSAGGATVLAATANSCCFDDRIRAAALVAPAVTPFTGGEYEWADAPPTLIAHAVDDEEISYNAGVAAFDQLPAPKAFLSLSTGGHNGWRENSDIAAEFASAVEAFLSVHLTGSDEASERLHDDSTRQATTLYVGEVGADAPVVPTTTVAGVDRRASVDRPSGLADGDVVTVEWSGHTPGGTVNVVQCAGGGLEGPDFCNLDDGRFFLDNPTGSGSVELTIRAGAIGAGECGPATDDCVIAVEDFGDPSDDGGVFLAITFAS